ncbi:MULTISPECIES: hypothetical protein [Dickeya]|uniref:hypothetical protein n=1 Tax=Dickeya TaxID=204037 RepID=UPI0003A167D3|nr:MULTISPECIES: hypothetical protein [Dickeya]TYL44121.1 hypothetical protein FDP13_04850 [Dickeya sp. ws52]
MRLVAIVIPLSLVLTGCAVNMADCDPTTGDTSLVNKFNCNYSGTYNQRVQVKEQTLQHEQELNKEFKAVLSAITQEQSQVKLELGNTQANHQALNASVGDLLAKLKKKSAGKVQLQRQIAELEANMKRAQSQPSRSVMEKQLELENLRSQVMTLQQSLD